MSSARWNNGKGARHVPFVPQKTTWRRNDSLAGRAVRGGYPGYALSL